ncbi:MAG: hypothetical protein ACI4BI_04925 [Anaerotardibacter sp.]
MANYEDEANKLPEPKQYNGPHFSVLDYLNPKYEGAKTLEEAIAMRGEYAFFEKVTANDFAFSEIEGFSLLGFADLWAQSTWYESVPSSRDIKTELDAYELKEGEFIEVKRCTPDISEREIAFYTMDNKLLPYSPYHDYDDLSLTKWINELNPSEKMLCRVKEVTCYGGDGVEKDPFFCWRVYACSTEVFKVKQ